MDELENTIRAIGISASSLPKTDEDRRALRRLLFERYGGGRPDFNFLRRAPVDDSFDFIKGLVRCEALGVSPGVGSVSLVITAFGNVRENFPVETWSPIADWVIRNHDNPWSPFNFRNERDYWEVAQELSSDPVEIAGRAIELQRIAEAEKDTRASRHDIRQQISRLHKEAPSSPELRQRIIEELEREAGWNE